MFKRAALFAVVMLSGAAFAQWQHVGPIAVNPNTGVQSVDGRLVFHVSNNGGKHYVSDDLGQSWDTLEFSTLGSSNRYAVHNGTEYLSFYNGYSGGIRLWRKNPETGHYQQKHLSCQNYEVLESGRIVLCTRNNADQVAISDDRGETWTTTFPGTGAFRSRMLGRDAEGRLLVQTYEWNGGAPDSLGLWRSADNGASWHKISNILYNLDYAHVGADGHIFAANGRRILHSSDNGETWDEPWEVGAFHNGYSGSTVFHAGNGRVYFMRYIEVQQPTDTINLYVSEDYGQTWTAVNDAVAAHKALGMTWHDGTLFLSTNNGVYRSGTATGVAEHAAAEVHLYPNPARDQVMVNAGRVPIETVRVYDQAGREVMTHEKVGVPVFALSTARLVPGSYVVRAETRAGRVTRQLVVQ
ncbi:MAG: T9SS type A sorting domain-containing protein [Flavobacteriales bacterium]|nr:T9SS type A sorting domain-containing protein [Flavobacteriales bacterium]